MERKFTFIKILIVLLIFLTPCRSSAAISFSTPFVGTSYCAGDSFLVGIRGTSLYTGTNVFTVELSNGLGSFATPIVIGTKADSLDSTVIRCYIPMSIIPLGTGYRIKIRANHPVDSSANNGYNITLTRVPVPVISDNSSLVCPGDSLLLSGSDSLLSATYSWTGPSGFSSSQQNPGIQNASTANNGTYLLVASLNGCSASRSSIINIKPLPNNPNAASNSPVCAGDSLKLTSTATPGATYSWAGPGGFSATVQNTGKINIPLTAAGNYIVSVNLNGCKVADTIAVTVKPSPATPTASADPVGCSGVPFHLFSATVAGVSYSWVGPSGFTSGLQNPVITNPATSATGRYIVSATAGGCTTSDTVFVSVNTSPVLSPLTSSGNCEGDSLKIHTASSFSGTYFWSSTGFNTTSATGDMVRPNATTAYSGTYLLYMQSVPGCNSDTVSLPVVIKPVPAVPSIVTNSPVCAGHDLLLNASSTTTGVSYSWSGPSGLNFSNATVLLPNVTIKQSGKYSITTSLNGCSSSASADIVVNPYINPDVTISADPGVAVRILTPVKFTAHSWNAGDHPSYQWRINDIDIPGATDSIYSCTAGKEINEKDRVSVRIISNAPCAFPDTVISYVFTMLIKDISDVIANDVTISPNPNRGSFVIQGSVNTDNVVDIKVLNIIGQIIYRDEVLPVNKHIYLAVNLGSLSTGIYVVELKADDRIINKRILVR